MYTKCENGSSRELREPWSARPRHESRGSFLEKSPRRVTANRPRKHRMRDSWILRSSSTSSGFPQNRGVIVWRPTRHGWVASEGSLPLRFATDGGSCADFAQNRAAGQEKRDARPVPGFHAAQLHEYDSYRPWLSCVSVAAPLRSGDVSRGSERLGASATRRTPSGVSNRPAPALPKAFD